MGEAVYYLKATFASKQKAQKAEKKVRPILEGLIKYYNEDNKENSKYKAFENGDLNEDYDLGVLNNELRLDCEVWHLADWDCFMPIFYEAGAKKVNWVSDEYIDAYEAI